MSNIELSTYTPDELLAIMNIEVNFEEVVDEKLVDDLIMIAGYTEEEAREAAKAIKKEDQIKF
jgi:hypothetical protein|tara:strand:+ start:334 stop:522 length:189 start_codon:yes stop_codon:yes gene_type:complete